MCESYREIFLSNYCDNQSILKEKLEVTTACEPYLRLNELEVRAAALNRYLNASGGEQELYGRGKSRPFHQQLYHTGQNDQQSGGLRPAQRHAFVIEGGVARDPAMLTNILEYKNKIDDIDMRTQQLTMTPTKRAFPSTKNP